MRSGLLLALLLCSLPPAPAAAESPRSCSAALYYLERGDAERALATLDPRQETPAGAANIRGVALMLRRDFRPAAAAFEEALRHEPELTAARYNLAVALIELGQLESAKKQLAVISRQQDRALAGPVEFQSGLISLREGNREGALQSFRKAAALGHSVALLHEGTLLEEKGDLQGAGRAYKQYLDGHPDSLFAMLRFGIAAHRAGKLDTARSTLRRVIEIAPDGEEAATARKFLVMWE